MGLDMPSGGKQSLRAERQPKRRTVVGALVLGEGRIAKSVCQACLQHRPSPNRARRFVVGQSTFFCVRARLSRVLQGT